MAWLSSLLVWVKANKITAALVVLVVWLAWPSIFGNSLSLRNMTGVSQMGYGSVDMMGDPYSMGSESVKSFSSSYSSDYAPQTETSTRMVVQNTSLSMVVKEVSQVQTDIIQQAEGLGGYMVSSNLTNPVEAPYGQIEVRIPVEKLNLAMDYFRSLALKVTSENLVGKDVTDQYQDLDAHLQILNDTKSRYEEIRDKSVTVAELLEVQRELVNLQYQIDQSKGQQVYLSQNAALAKVTIYISTDELALPYTPTESFRPLVIYKYAVRGLLGSLAKIATYGIWALVYSVIWGPILLGFLWFLRRTKSHQLYQPQNKTSLLKKA